MSVRFAHAVQDSPKMKHLKCERSELANEVSRAKRDNRRLLGYWVIGLLGYWVIGLLCELFNNINNSHIR